MLAVKIIFISNKKILFSNRNKRENFIELSLEYLVFMLCMVYVSGTSLLDDSDDGMMVDMSFPKKLCTSIMNPNSSGSTKEKAKPIRP